MQSVFHSNVRMFEPTAPSHFGGESWKALSIEELVQKCQVGEHDALEELIRRYKRSIYSMAHLLTKNHADVEDIAAEALFRICRGIRTFKASMALPAWINRIVRNVWYDMQRRVQRRPALSLDGLEADAVDRFLFTAEGKEAGSLQEYAEANERKRILENAMKTLPAFQCKIVTLYYCEERTYEDIAQIMDIPIGTVKSRLNRARFALREKLESQLPVLIN